MSDDLYKILEVDPQAEPEVIQSSYRALARRVHPDVTGEDEDMKRLNQAWEVLKDPARRAMYDHQREGDLVQAAKREHVESAGVHAITRDLNSRDPNWAGPPPGNAYGTIVPFGRYKGWSVAEIARFDPDWLDWLTRVPSGRRFKAEIETILADVREGRDPAPFRHKDLFAAAESAR